MSKISVDSEILLDPHEIRLIAYMLNGVISATVVMKDGSRVEVDVDILATKLQAQLKHALPAKAKKHSRKK